MCTLSTHLGTYPPTVGTHCTLKAAVTLKCTDFDSQTSCSESHLWEYILLLLHQFEYSKNVKQYFNN